MASLNPPSRRRLHHQDLTKSAFSAFGTVIENSMAQSSDLAIPDQFSSSSRIVYANQRTALKHKDVAHMSNAYAHSPSQTLGKAVMNMFTCFPRTLAEARDDNESRVLQIRVLERHPFTTQTFIPMGLSAMDCATRYLVIVAPSLIAVGDALDQGPPDLANVQAFLAHGGQGISYRAGTWHAPMAVVGENKVDFVVVQFCNGVDAEDCQEVDLDGEGLELVVKMGVQ